MLSEDRPLSIKISGSLDLVHEDFPGAFIIAVRSGKIIPLEEARKQNK